MTYTDSIRLVFARMCPMLTAAIRKNMEALGYDE